MDEGFRVLELARLVCDDVTAFLNENRGRALHDKQLRESAQSIAANIREAYGRRTAPAQNQFFGFACGSAEETDEHLHSNLRNKLLPEKRFWTLHNRLTVIQKMLESLMRQRRRKRRRQA